MVTEYQVFNRITDEWRSFRSQDQAIKFANELAGDPKYHPVFVDGFDADGDLITSIKVSDQIGGSL
jgi:hypothetical protein